MSTQNDTTRHDQDAQHVRNTQDAYETTSEGTTGRDAGVSIAEYPDYASAQAAVDLLSDAKFDVSAVQIVGHGLQSVEDVRGRMTKGRAAGYGAGSGAWFGLLLGLLLGLFLPNPLWLNFILGGVVLGALWGAIFGFFGHLATGGRRDFTSIKAIEASRYEILVTRGLAAEASRILGAGR